MGLMRTFSIIPKGDLAGYKKSSDGDDLWYGVIKFLKISITMKHIAKPN